MILVRTQTEWGEEDAICFWVAASANHANRTIRDFPRVWLLIQQLFLKADVSRTSASVI